MFACISCICFIEINIILSLTDITNYMPTSSPAFGAQEQLDGKLCILASWKWTLKTMIRQGGCLTMHSLCEQDFCWSRCRSMLLSSQYKYNMSKCYYFFLAHYFQYTTKSQIIHKSMSTLFGQNDPSMK